LCCCYDKDDYSLRVCCVSMRGLVSSRNEWDSAWPQTRSCSCHAMSSLNSLFRSTLRRPAWIDYSVIRAVNGLLLHQLSSVSPSELTLLRTSHLIYRPSPRIRPSSHLRILPVVVNRVVTEQWAFIGTLASPNSSPPASPSYSSEPRSGAKRSQPSILTECHSHQFVTDSVAQFTPS